MSASKHTGSTPTREMVLKALGSLSEGLGEQNVTGEIRLFDDAVMLLAFTARLATKDVDAIFRPAHSIRELAGRIAEDQHLPADWLNDGVKGFVSARHETTAGNLPQFPHLRLTMPVPEYLLAMKCMAARLGGTTGEGSDVPPATPLDRRRNSAAPPSVVRYAARRRARRAAAGKPACLPRPKSFRERERAFPRLRSEALSSRDFPHVGSG